MKRYNVITLCGSAKFKEDFERVNKELTLEGSVIISVGFFEQEGESITEEQKIMLGEIHKRKIDLADEIFVINKDNYIGQSTRQEIAYAFAHGKKIRFLENPVREQHSWRVIDCCSYKGDSNIEMCSNCHELRWTVCPVSCNK